MELYKVIEDSISETLRNRFSETVYNLWFKELHVEKVEEHLVEISTTTPFKAKIISEHHLPALQNALQTALGFPVEIKLSIRETDMEKEREAIASQPDPIEIEEEVKDKIDNDTMIRNIEGKELVSGYTFENFIVGDSNRFAHAACVAVADSFTTDEEILTNPLEERYNPLFIYGQSGLGKTHLLYAITNEIKQRTPNVKFIYIRGEDFVNQLIESLRTGSTSAFRQKYRNTDVLLIDDIHFIGGKEAIQEEFFNTFNALYEDQKQIILTSDRPPHEIKNLTDRLRTRFEWGLTADIQPPSTELRAAIIKTKAEKQGISLSDDIISYMAENIKSNIRTIEGAIRKLYAMNILTGSPISLESAKRSLADIQSGAGEAPFLADKIFSSVSKHFDIPVDTIKGNRRQSNIVYARHVCMYLLRKLTEYPLTDIGTFFGCHHSNVILSCNKIESMMESTPSIKNEVESLIEKIQS